MSRVPYPKADNLSYLYSYLNSKEIVMAQYKVVQVPRNISVGHDGNTQEALNQFQNVIEKEASEGWELVGIMALIKMKIAIRSLTIG
jgi:hypothetical protein